MSNATELRFSVDAQLVRELGERLVTRNYLALAELVKNAYDADATEVTVHLVRASQPSATAAPSQIVVSDNGTGMSRATVENVWMRVATSSKLFERRSRVYGRPCVGNKGIGRFACHRLAEKLLMETRQRAPDGSIEQATVLIEWANFKPGVELSAVECDADFTRSPDGSSGTRLTLDSLRETWSENDFRLLQRQLLAIAVLPPTRRPGFPEDPGFGLRIQSDEFTEGSIDLTSLPMDAGWGRLRATISQDGVLTANLRHHNTRREIKHTFPDRFSRIPITEVDVAMMPEKRSRMRRPEILTATATREILDAVAGVRVFLDGFRVYPYGEPGDDWLQLSADAARRKTRHDSALDPVAEALGLSSRTMLNLPRSGNLVGRISVSSDHASTLTPKTDREGFVESPAYEELFKATRLCIDWMTLHYERYLRDESAKALRQATEDLVGPNSKEAPERSAIKFLKTIAAQTRSDNLDAAGVLPKLKTASKAIVAATDMMEAEIASLRIVASSSPVLLAFIHDVKGLVGRIVTHESTIEACARRADGQTAQRLRSVRDDLSHTQKLLHAQISLYSEIAGSARSKPATVSVRDVSRAVLLGFDSIIKRYDIELDVTGISAHAAVHHIRQGELISIIANAVSNAVKAMIPVNRRRLKLEFSTLERPELRVLDSGIGVPEKARDRIFRMRDDDAIAAFYEQIEARIDPSDRVVLGSGTGIGLGIIRGIAESRGGTAEFISPPKGWSTCLRIVL